MEETTKNNIDEGEDILCEQEGVSPERETSTEEEAPLRDAYTATSTKKNSFWSLMGGSFIEHPWIASNWKLGLVIVLMSVINIWNGYEAIEQVREIGRLEEQVKDYRYRALFKASEATAMSQKLNVEKAIQAQNLELTLSQTPPYILYRPVDKDQRKK